jgi:hypothetical protein
MEFGFIPSGGGGAAGGPSYAAPIDAEYLVLTLTGDLDAERLFVAGTGLSYVDDGPNDNYTLSVDPSEIDHNLLTGIDESGEDFHHLTWSEYGILTDSSNADTLHVHDHNALEGIDESGEDYHHLTWLEYLDLTDGGASTAHKHAHNDMDSKQGGSGSEFYHLTATQHDLLTDEGDVDNADSMHTHDGKADVSHALSSHTQGSNKIFMTNGAVFTEIDLGASGTYLKSQGDGSDLIWDTPPDTGEANTGTNLGAGAGVYEGMDGTTLEFRSLLDSSQIDFTQNTNDITASIVAGSVDTTELANDAVTNDKIADDAVDTDQLADNAVNEARIVDSAVSLAKIQDITTSRILGRTTAGDGVVEQLQGSDVGGMVDHNDLANKDVGDYQHLTEDQHDKNIIGQGVSVTTDYVCVWDGTGGNNIKQGTLHVDPVTFLTTVSSFYSIGAATFGAGLTVAGNIVMSTADATVDGVDLTKHVAGTAHNHSGEDITPETYNTLTIDISNETEPDFDDGFKFELVLDDDCEVQMPLNPAEGYMMELRVIQDGGSNALTFDSDKFHEGEITDITADQTDGNVTYYLFKYNENSGDMDIVAVNRGYPNA